MSTSPAHAPAAQRSRLFRARSSHGHHRVTYVELFFDLVFVFAVTQLSHRLLEHFTPRNLAETALLMIAVWWVWIYTSWITNWLDPDSAPVRLMLLTLMLAGLGLSTSLPAAFGERGQIFALSYTGMQVGRTLFMFVSIPRGDVLRPNFARILVWFAASSLLWLWGVSQPPDERLLIWALALGIELVGPFARFWTPGLGAARVGDWDVEGGHLSERCALFIIIALGESVLVTGTTFSAQVWSPSCVVAFVIAFVGTLAMWWIYFDRSVELGTSRITAAVEPGRLARLAYTYLHLPIVAGIILSAVGNELVLAHPHEHAHGKTITFVVGGPLAYVVGALLFKHAIRGWFQPSHLVGIGLLVLLAIFGSAASAVLLMAGVTAVLLLIALWESLSLRSSQLEAALDPRQL